MGWQIGMGEGNVDWLEVRWTDQIINILLERNQEKWEGKDNTRRDLTVNKQRKSGKEK